MVSHARLARRFRLEREEIIARVGATYAPVLADLPALCRGTARGRGRADEITLFKSVGTAIADLAAARLVWQRTPTR